jgi:hypothetical protein
MKLDRLDQARFPSEPGAGFRENVWTAARMIKRPARPSLLPELLDAVGWAAAVWVGGFVAMQFFR